ncbi:unnamed protein product [Cyprideis torosa]|uniref:Cell growth-regulating nucleolar protein n=1 Tax=Cyprideis torosa TaxID=163714 RepID=A0A7R8WEE7_9CRUS|nr:unnamed protein product [Cyprideis torosa]CAG0895654.1 unnamed protein product [Cyprideis torosa]
MVFFTCNTCGASLKKNQVEKHHQFECKNCEAVSCMDCGKDFWGDEYASHTKCITEAEKYSGKDYKPKPNANKNEKKQEAWLEHIRAAVNSEEAQKDPKLKDILQRMAAYSNIPRKKSKFENFVRNSLTTRQPHLIEAAWRIFSASFTPTVPASQPKADESGKGGGEDDKEEVEEEETEEHNNANVNVDHQSESTGKSDEPGQHPVAMSKRERKLLRQNKNNRKEKKDLNHDLQQLTMSDDGEESVEAAHGKKKIGKRERQLSLSTQAQEEKQRKKKKKANSKMAAGDMVDDEDEEIQKARELKRLKREAKECGMEGVERNLNEPTLRAVPTGGSDEEGEKQQNGGHEATFRWIPVIESVLASKGELALKKLKRKVHAEYMACGGEKGKKLLAADEFDKKLMKKIRSCQKFALIGNERVCYVEADEG